MGLGMYDANRWVPCPASHKLEQLYPDTPYDDGRIKGLSEHGVAARLLKGDMIGPDDEVSSSVQFYVDDVKPYVTDMRASIEEKIPLNLAPISMNVIPDAAAWTPNRIIIWDYKAGRYPISAVENYQLLGYGVAILDSFEYPRLQHIEENYTLEMRIVQPRVTRKISTWSIPMVQLRNFRNIIKGAAEEALGSNPKTTAGNHCHYCKAILDCHSADKAAKVASSYSSYTLIEKRPNDQLAADLKMLKYAYRTMGDMIIAVEGHVESTIRQGGKMLGFGLESGNGKTVWDKDHHTVKALGDVYGVKLDKEALITPNQAKKAGVPESAVRAYTKRLPGALKLVESQQDERHKTIFLNRST